ncbi:DUF6414 family protein [Clostridium lundense]|uniref:DUF6414 family protein n=1 Tax=Clostridium lundense TaxID=319475 RepID=UPI0006842E24|nr:hypothetical protein [Clostridium lundense]
MGRIDIPIYINKNLILDLYGILINGYIESRTIRCVKDRSNGLRLQKGCKNGGGEDFKKSNNDKEKNIVKDVYKNYSDDLLGCFDDKNSIRNEISIKKIFTTFQIFTNLREIMIEENMLMIMGQENIINNRAIEGDYVEFEGKVSPISLQSQINTMINVLEAYDCKMLDNLLKTKEEKEVLTNYSTLLKQLKSLNENLNKNNTVNMIMDCNSYKAVLNVNSNNFLDKNSYIYDNVNCYCKVLCKIINVVDEKSCIDLLCKTCMSEYYCEFFNQMNPYLDLLTKNNILVPKNFCTKINGPAIQAIPVAMYC